MELKINFNHKYLYTVAGRSRNKGELEFSNQILFKKKVSQFLISEVVQ